jgi:hypothetical protein
MKCTPLYYLDTFVEQGPFQYVSMDLITDLPPSNKFDSILIIIDQGCSKAAKFIPYNKTIDGQGIAGLYLLHSSHGSEYPRESSQIMIQDSLVISQKQFAKPQIFTRILVQPFIHTPMDNLKK